MSYEPSATLNAGGGKSFVSTVWLNNLVEYYCSQTEPCNLSISLAQLRPLSFGISRKQARMAEQQRTTLATRPLIEALADPSRAAFTIKTLAGRPRDESLLRKWRHAFTNSNPYRKFAAWAFQYMFTNSFDSPGNDRWLPVRPLGAGSFGAAGLFEHQDDEGLVDDYVVAKYASAMQDYAVRANILGISREAAIMMQLNEIPNNEGVLFLRNFIHYEDTKLWLHLLEYCPSVNLEGLRLTYKAMRRTLPEAFLWYIFHALTKGLVTMEEGPFGEDLKPSELRNGAYLLHRDLKPENVLMGYSSIEEDPDKILSDPSKYMGTCLDYPYAKIADFGLSKITTNGDSLNTAAQQHNVGSASWRPPEMRISFIPPYESSNPFPSICFDSAGNLLDPNSVQTIDQHAYTPAGNTFVVGYMMYQLMTMDEPTTMDNYLNRILAQLEETPLGSVLDVDSIQERTNFLKNIIYANPAIAHMTQDDDHEKAQILTMLEQWRDVAYSVPLKTLVEDCLSFQPTDRPLATPLLQEISYHMHLYLYNNSALPGFEADAQVFHRPEDLSTMNVGEEPFQRSRQFWDRLHGMQKWLDPSTGYIRPDLLQPDVTKAAIAFFTPGMREEKNKAAATSQSYEDDDEVIRILNMPQGGSGQGSMARDNAQTPIADIRVDDEETPVVDIRLDDDEDAADEAMIKILNPSKRRKGTSGEVVRVRKEDDETPVTDIKLDDEDKNDEATVKIPNPSKRRKRASGDTIKVREDRQTPVATIRFDDSESGNGTAMTARMLNASRWRKIKFGSTCPSKGTMKSGSSSPSKRGKMKTGSTSPSKKRRGAVGGQGARQRARARVRVTEKNDDEEEEEDGTPPFANVEFFNG